MVQIQVMVVLLVGGLSTLLSAGGWEVDTSAQTCTYTPNSPATTLVLNIYLTLNNRSKSIELGGTRTGWGSLRVSVRAVNCYRYKQMLTINTNDIIYPTIQIVRIC